MTSQLTLSEWRDILDRTRFATVSDDSTGTNVFGSDIPEDRVRYVWGMILSETSGASNTLTINKVEEDDTTTTMINSLNLGASESIFLSLQDVGVLLPSLEGDTNVEFNANSDGVNATVFYFDNEV